MKSRSLKEVVLNCEPESIPELREEALHHRLVGDLWLSERLIGHSYLPI